MKHAQFSPSNAARWLACPGSIKAQERYPDITSAAAQSGLESHALLEYCLVSNIYDATALIGKTLMNTDIGFYIADADRVARVNEALTYVKQRILEQPTLTLKTEIKLDITTLEDEDSARVFGTADIVLVDREIIEVIDYKDGRTIIDPNSPQLRLYALGALRHFKTADDPRIICTIIQPRRLEQGYQSSSVQINLRLSSLLDWETRIVKPALRNALSETPDFAIGTHCTYCKHLKNCVAHHHNVDEFFDTVIAGNGDTSSFTDKTREISNEEISRVLTLRAGMEAYFDAINEEAIRRLKNGQIIENFKLKTRKSRLEWTTDREIIESIFTRKRLPKYAYMESKLATPTQLKAKLKSGKLTDLQIKQIEAAIEKYADRKPDTDHIACDNPLETTSPVVNIPDCVL